MTRSKPSPQAVPRWHGVEQSPSDILGPSFERLFQALRTILTKKPLFFSFCQPWRYKTNQLVPFVIRCLPFPAHFLFPLHSGKPWADILHAGAAHACATLACSHTSDATTPQTKAQVITKPIKKALYQALMLFSGPRWLQTEDSLWMIHLFKNSNHFEPIWVFWLTWSLLRWLCSLTSTIPHKYLYTIFSF